MTELGGSISELPTGAKMWSFLDKIVRALISQCNVKEVPGAARAAVE